MSTNTEDLKNVAPETVEAIMALATIKLELKGNSADQNNADKIPVGE